jgi:hypothetical protein
MTRAIKTAHEFLKANKFKVTIVNSSCLLFVNHSTAYLDCDTHIELSELQWFASVIADEFLLIDIDA